MAWVRIDDISADRLSDDEAHEVVIRHNGATIEALDLGEVTCARVLDGLRMVVGQLRAGALVEELATRVRGGADETPTPAPANGHQLPDQPEREPEPQVGEAVSGQATDAQVRAWCAEHGVPCSTHGKLNGSARTAYEKAHAPDPEPPAAPRNAAGEGEPAPDTSRGAPPAPGPATAPAPPAEAVPPEQRTTPKVHPDQATDSYIEAWCVRNAVPYRGPRWANAKRHYATAYRAGQPAEPAVQPAGDGTAARPEQIDEAERIARTEVVTPVVLCQRTGIGLEEARRIVKDVRDQKRDNTR